MGDGAWRRLVLHEKVLVAKRGVRGWGLLTAAGLTEGGEGSGGEKRDETQKGYQFIMSNRSAGCHGKRER